MDANPNPVQGGTPASGTAVISTGAPDGGAVISLVSSNPSIASVPASATAPANSFTADFTITTSPVTVATNVTITGSYGGNTRTVTLTVTPNSGPILSNLFLNPSTVTGGTADQGGVVLTAAAPADSVVSLSSSKPAVASVPASVTVAAGSQSGVFNLTTTHVTASTQVTITATFNGTTKTAVLTLTP